MMKKSAIVVGATGLVGQQLLKKLCEDGRYISVTAIGRNVSVYQHEKLQSVFRSFEQISEADLEIVDEVFCCLGTTIKKAKSREQFEKVDFEYPMRIASLAKKVGIPHFLVISAMGANEKSAAYYSRVKGKLEIELEKLAFPRLSIIRPSLLLGDRTEFRLGERAGAMVLNLLNPLLVGPLSKVRAISAEQVGEAMVAIALMENKKGIAIYSSNELQTLKIPPVPVVQEETIDREATFNWQKKEEIDVVDDEVVFDRSKIKTVDDEEIR